MPSATSKKPKIYVKGVEITDIVDFKSWQPGFEYTKNIKLKNLNTKSVRISYEIPKTRFFTTLYPKQISLSPGTTFNLPITFRPLEKVVYNDQINFHFHDFHHDFAVSVLGSLPIFKLEVVQSLDFGMCNAFENVEQEVELKNLSELDTTFLWDTRAPFNVLPTSGEIKGNQSIILTITACSSSAAVYSGTAVCKYGATLSELYEYEVIELKAIGKYPHILVESDDESRCNQISLNFENTPFGKSITKYFSVVNMTPVKTTFFIERIKNIPKFDCCFSCQQENGVLLPYETQKIPISYTPNVPIQEICDYFNVYSSGKLSKASVQCFGTSKVLKVGIEPFSLNFGQCDISQTSPRTFQITNFGDVEVAFQFDSDSTQSSFWLSCTNGKLKSGETKLIQVILKPQFSIVYHKKLACLIENHDVLFIDLYGTCHSETIKPAVLNAVNLKNYYKFLENGLTLNPPEQLVEMNSDGSLVKALQNENENMSSFEEFFKTEYQDDETAKIKHHVRIDTPYVDFGAVPNINDEIPQQKSITLFNNTKGKLFICWNKSNEDKTFTITPQTAEIPPLKSYSFRITFKPPKPSQFYDTMLEGYALYKSLCDYTVVSQQFVLPSWCLNIRCSGHSFHSFEEHFPPYYTVDTENLIFPITVVDKPVFKTLTIKNTVDSYPIVFNVDPTLFNKWEVKPHKGLIKPQEHQIFVFKFTPKEETHLYEKCEIKLNEMNKHILELLLISTAEIARVEISNNGFLYFKPTCKGNSTRRDYEIINKTRIPINYEWKLPYEAKNLFTPLELTGSLKPYENRLTPWLFTPKKFEKYNIKARLIAWIGENRNKSEVYNLRLLGSCTTGGLQALEVYKDFGSVVVGGSASSEIILINNNDCALDYDLVVKQTVDDDSANKYLNDPCILELEETSGNIEARSKKIIPCRIRPARVISYQFLVEYKIIYPNDEEKFDLPYDVICQMTANGVFPKIRVTDVKAIGSASNLSKDYLWRLFSIDSLNSTLSCEPNAEELIYSIATRQEANRRIPNKPKVMLDFNFNAAPAGSPDTEIALFLENNGVVTTEWSIQFPRDLQIELEYWADSGEYDEDDLEQMKIQDNKLFSITPKHGSLEPGETIRLQLTYRHALLGVNKLPVLLKLARGREIMINLSGVTVPIYTPYVYFPTNKYQFLPVEIGLLDYPIQIFELYNGGDKPARVQIDTSQLINLAIQNYSHNVLECLSDEEIIIPPGTSYPTKWKFSPLEAKTYQIDVVFKNELNESNLVTFTCIGYDNRRLNNFTVKTLVHEDIPNQQLFILPEQLASLSIDRIVFGDVPLFSRERKMLFVKNNSTEHKISFNWHVTTPEHVKYIRIQPSRGLVNVGQSKLCKLTFLAKSVPSFYNLDLICEIKNETQMDKYFKDLEAWENEQKRQWEEFQIEDEELENRLAGPEKIDKKIASSIEFTKPSSQLSLHHFKTIPPILANNYLMESSITKVRRLRKEKKMWIKPTPPIPFVLHLNVIARTQYLSEYLQSSNSNEETTKFIDGLLGSTAEMSSIGAESQSLTTSMATYAAELKKPICSDDEIETVGFVLSDVLRSLITDKSFLSLTSKIKDEQIPYFLQYSQKKIGGYRKYGESSLDTHIDENTKRKRSVTIAENTKHKNLAIPSPIEQNTNRSQKIAEKPELLDSSFKIAENEVEIEDVDKKIQGDAEKFDVKQKIKISPVFGSIIENIIENTLGNILIEAFNNEFNITSRPRLIALPPKSSLHNSLQASQEIVDQKIEQKETSRSQTNSQLKLKPGSISNSTPEIRSGTNTVQK